jgi:uncharacterized protein (TIGR02246 family)
MRWPLIISAAFAAGSIAWSPDAIAQSERWVNPDQPLPPPPVTESGIHNESDERPQAAVQAYFDALNRSDVDAAVTVYAADGYFALQGTEDVQGTAALRALYEGTFKAVRFNATYIFNEVRVYGDEAFVRTTTNASLTMVATGQVISNRYREFFVLKRVGGRWKIDRYMNNKPTP